MTKGGCGVHGASDPRPIGKSPSHGCVRLTNWDAKELSRAVAAGNTVVFVDRASVRRDRGAKALSRPAY